MGVEYELRCSECKERVILYKLRESYEPVQQIVDGTFKASELLELPDWARTLIDDRCMWQIKEALKFKERHPNCELFLWNDHADFGDEEGRYYPLMDIYKSLPRTEEFERNLKEKTRLYVEEGVITNRYSLPHNYSKREDLIINIPCEGPTKKLIHTFGGQRGIDGEWGEQEYVEYIFTIEDKRLFKYCPRGMSGEFITPEELETEIKKLTENPQIDFEVVELNG